MLVYCRVTPSIKFAGTHITIHLNEERYYESKVSCPRTQCNVPGQAPVVRRVDNAIHRINHYPADSVVCFVNTYPLDSDLSGG